MALKDWKKAGNNWLNTKNSIELAVYYEEDYWVVEAVKIKDEAAVFIKYPKSKKEGLSIAKDYMRKH